MLHDLKRRMIVLFFLMLTPSAWAAHVELVLKRMTLSSGQVLEPGALIEIVDWQELSDAQYRRFRVLSDSTGQAPSDPKAVYRESAVSFEGTTTPIDLLRVVAKPKEQTGCSQQALETAARTYRANYFDRYPKLIPAGHTAMASHQEIARTTSTSPTLKCCNPGKRSVICWSIKRGKIRKFLRSHLVTRIHLMRAWVAWGCSEDAGFL